MPDVAQEALLVPDPLPGLDIATLVTGLLVWDRVLVPRGQAFGADTNRVEELLGRLEQIGACEFVDLPSPAPRGHSSERANYSAGELSTRSADCRP